MSNINPGRFHTNYDKDFVLFLLGMKVHHLYKVHKWLPVFSKVPAMFAELEREKNIGYLGGHYRISISQPLIIQYWNSLEELLAYAKNPNQAHLPVWKKFNQLIGKSNDVGIWHETYLIKKEQQENIYVNMPPVGLGKFSNLIPVTKQTGNAKARF